MDNNETEQNQQPEQAAVAFNSLALIEPVLRAVDELGYEDATPVQAECIPHMLAGRDVLGQAQTGTGKTAAFALPLLTRIDLAQRDPQALILAPTRELALQVSEALQTYARHMPGFHVLPVYGGQGMGLQLRQLKRGTHVIVGTPGRVMDHLRRGSLNLGGLTTLVLDEADEMLNMGFIEDIEWILEQTPQQRQIALFSATMPAVIKRVAGKHLNDPVHVKVASKTVTGSTISQRHCVVTPQHKLDVLTRLMEVEDFDAMLIFVRTRTMTVELAEKLTAHGMAAEALNGDMSQDVRERTVNGLKQGRIDVVVATDVAARGLDVDRISHVINYDIPNNPESYVHRIGRTGRAGRAGKALLFVHPRERYQLKAIERATGQRIPPVEMPSADEISQHRVSRFVERVREVLSNQDMDFYYRMVANLETEQEISLLDIAAALTYLSQGGKPFEVRELKSSARPSRNDSGQQRFGRERGGFDRAEGRNQGHRPDRRPDNRSDHRADHRDDRRPPPRSEQRPDQRPEQRSDHYRGDGNEQPYQRPPQRDNYAAVRGSQDVARPAQHDRDGWSPPRFSRDPGDGQQPPAPQREQHRSDGFESSDYGRGNPRQQPPQRPDYQQRQAPAQQRGAGEDIKRLPYRIAVGYDHGVSPGEIVGAIANELGIEGRHIGKIDIHDRYSVVGLPQGMPAELFKQLRRVHVRGQTLRARLWDEHTGAPAGFPGADDDRSGNHRPAPRLDGSERPKRKLKKSKAGKKKKRAERRS